MKTQCLLAFCLLAGTASCGQSEYRIALKSANPSLAIPVMAAGGGSVYIAYRSFDWMRFSSQLQVIAYDLTSHKELRRATLAVPKVHGSRVSEGLVLSNDGKMLAYVEAHAPDLVLLLSAQDLSEIRRSTVSPFTADDHQRTFAGFDGNQLCLASNVYRFDDPTINGLRFIRMDTPSLTVVSDSKAAGLTQETSASIVWMPHLKKTWVNKYTKDGRNGWQQYSEDGHPTDQIVDYQGQGIARGATAFENSDLLAFYGKLADGTVVSYKDHRSMELKLQCVPQPYGTSNVAEYAGSICITQRDVLPEAGGDKIVTSEFLLLKTNGPTIMWRRAMDQIDIAEGFTPEGWFQKGGPLILQVRAKIIVVAPSKSPFLTVNEIETANSVAEKDDQASDLAVGPAVNVN